MSRSAELEERCLLSPVEKGQKPSAKVTGEVQLCHIHSRCKSPLWVCNVNSMRKLGGFLHKISIIDT